jgi:hypothetical protein
LTVIIRQRIGNVPISKFSVYSEDLMIKCPDQ